MRSLRVALVVGSYPPQADGAEDYTVRLAEVLRQEGAEVHIIAGGEWSVFRTLGLTREISRLRPHLIHIQYPTMGYRKSLVPQALSVFMPKVTMLATIHEFSQTHVLRRVSNLPFALCNRALVFTNEHERRCFLSWFPWVKRKSVVIPIGSNIPFSPGSVERDPLEIVHFGLVRPQKGIEDFLELARLARDYGAHSYRFTLIGEPVARFSAYLQNLKHSAKKVGVEWKLGLSAEEVAQCLAGSRFAYLPFPDGASERRASLLAALGNGVTVITTPGSQTTLKLQEAVRFAASPSQALKLLDKLILDTHQAHDLSLKGRKYADRYSWTSISHAHLQLYERVLSSSR